MVLYRNLHHRWVYVSEDKALCLAVRFYQLAPDKDCIKDINKRFRDIEFTKEQLHKLRYNRKEK